MENYAMIYDKTLSSIDPVLRSFLGSIIAKEPRSYFARSTIEHLPPDPTLKTTHPAHPLDCTTKRAFYDAAGGGHIIYIVDEDKW
jgi:hypothetical protein